MTQTSPVTHVNHANSTRHLVDLYSAYVEDK